MIPARFSYICAASSDEAVAALAEHGDEAKLLAGGHSLIPLLKLRLASPGVVVDIGRIHDLSYIRESGSHVAIGALTTHSEIERSPLVRSEVPLLAAVTGQVGDPQVRARGTIGGALAHGDAAADHPAALIALRGSVVVQGPSGKREIAVDDLFESFLETSIAPDEMVVEVRVPRCAKVPWSFQKFNRRAQDWAIVGVAVLLQDGDPSIGLVNMGSTPVRAEATEQALRDGLSSADAARLADEGTAPPSDNNADAAYRRHLAQVLVGRALAGAVV